MVLLDQLFDMREHQDTPLGNFSQLRDDQTFTSASRQHNYGRSPLFPEVFEGAIDEMLSGA